MLKANLLRLFYCLPLIVFSWTGFAEQKEVPHWYAGLKNPHGSWLGYKCGSCRGHQDTYPPELQEILTQPAKFIPEEKDPPDHELQALWNELFGGEVFIPRLDNDLARLVRDPDKKCATQVDSVIASTLAYGDAVMAESWERAGSLYEEIQKTVLTGGELPECQEIAARTYLMTSAELSRRWIYKRVEPNPDLDSKLPPGIRLTLLAAAFVNHLNIEFLTPAKKTSLDQDWNPQFIGTYNCSDSKITLDLTLHPFDLSATFFHELDHFYRDRLGGALFRNDEFHPHFPSSDEIIWPRYILFDESVASSLAAFQQLFALKNLSRNGRKNAQKSGDFTLVALDGSVQAGWSLGPPDETYTLTDVAANQVKKSLQLLGDSRKNQPWDPSGFEFLTSLYVGGVAGWINSPYVTPVDDLKKPSHFMVDDAHHITHRISDSYFGAHRNGSTKRSSRDQDGDDEEFTFDTDTPGGFLESFGISSFLVLEASPGLRDHGLGWRALLRDLHGLLIETQPNQKLCKMFGDAILNGKLDHYIGLSIKNSRTRPGEKGVRPGEKGVRPTIRPCLRPHGGL